MLGPIGTFTFGCFCGFCLTALVASFGIFAWQFLKKFRNNNTIMGKKDVSHTASIEADTTTSRFRWIPTSEKALEEAESKLVKQSVKNFLFGRFTPVLEGKAEIWSIACAPCSVSTGESGRPFSLADAGATESSILHGKVPVVLLHGFGSGVALWLGNLDVLSKNRVVHACDMLGFGRSSRIKFSSDPEKAEGEWVQALEDWREQMKLEQFILVGHSLGGFMASAYTLAHPSRVRHLVLVDAWGLPVKPDNPEEELRIPGWARIVITVAMRFSPLATLRLAGPWGPSLVKRFRPDLGRKFIGIAADEQAVFDYIYHCNAQKPSGEIAFKTLSIPLRWAKRPMIERLPTLPTDLPITFIHGAKSWIDSGPAYEIEFNLRKDSYVKVELIEGAGHHVYIDRVNEFNALMLNLCARVDAGLDTPQHKDSISRRSSRD